MDAYFCYIWERGPIPEMRPLACEDLAELDIQLSDILAEHPDAVLDIFSGDRMIERRVGPKWRGRR